ncbi:AAA family ATPase [Bacteroides gallinaceum]|uniref:ATP-binding protein n=1 Tax=Bacteroides gallinaceum TaxID=1462571 RepID=UPI0025AB1B76|nr:ATP-binding protein [Bacteroides gallinaceum]MDN0077858.1 AAA family ATPase [Bacteroides gallinaceum]
MEQVKVKGIPYGVANFEQLRNENLYYVDKTMYLPLLENMSNYLFLIRPRRFGKSVFVSMMRDYYDTAKADRFDTLFDGLWVKKHPTPLKNAFQVIYFDFSIVGTGFNEQELEQNFNKYCCQVLDVFAEIYAGFYDDGFEQAVKQESSARSKLNYINLHAHKKGYPLYLIIDEYDNFTNVILSDGGKELFRRLTHASGFYREYFKIFKAMFSRVFLIGVSPVTLDDLSSGYNIDWNISQAPEFNHMLGFSESDVRTMFHYYQDNGRLRADADIEAMMAEMKPWYNNYCFAKQCLNDDRLYNCDMVYYYLRHQVFYGCPPDEMVDKNIRTDYKKLKMLADIDRGNQRENRMSVIEEIAATGSILMTLKTSFPAEYVTDDNNFRSLLYYYGLLTMDSMEWDELRMVIPNNCVKEQYWGFMRDYYRRSFDVDLSALKKGFRMMAGDGEWKTVVERIATAYRENSSVRDSILGDHNLQGFFKAYLALNSLYLVEPEIELNYGFSDFLLLPDKARYPGIAHSYIMELKYVKPTATDAEIQEKSREADEQLKKYSEDKIVKRLCAGTQLHLLKVVFRGAEMEVCIETEKF